MKIFTYCPRCGATSGSYPRSHEFLCTDCGFRYFHGVSAACGIFLCQGDKVLLVERARDPAKGKFGLPGGFVDPGETVEQSLKREIEEEVSLLPGQYSLPTWLCSQPNTYCFESVLYHTADLYFTAELLCAESAIQTLDGELSSWKWVRADDVTLDDLAFDSLKAAWVQFTVYNS